MMVKQLGLQIEVACSSPLDANRREHGLQAPGESHTPLGF
jgi:hypothetical protein